MSIKYNISQNGRRIETFTSGTLNIEEVFNYFNNLQREDNIKPSAIEVVYFSLDTDFKISYSECEMITQRTDGEKLRRTIMATIFVCETDLSYGMGRMLHTLYDSGNHKHNILIVRSKKEIDKIIQKHLISRVTYKS